MLDEGQSQDVVDTFEDVCNICGQRQVFVGDRPWLREGYECSQCRGSCGIAGRPS